MIYTVYNFDDLDLGAGIFFEKWGATENWDINSEIGDSHISAHLYWG